MSFRRAAVWSLIYVVAALRGQRRGLDAEERVLGVAACEQLIGDANRGGGGDREPDRDRPLLGRDVGLGDPDHLPWPSTTAPLELPGGIGASVCIRSTSAADCCADPERSVKPGDDAGGDRFLEAQRAAEDDGEHAHRR